MEGRDLLFSPRLLPHRLRAVALLASAVAVACARGEASDDQSPIHVIDDTGRAVLLPRPATRVVSLDPSATETLVRLGAADRLVARTAFDRDPVITGLPVIARGSLAPSVEVVIELDPDLVVVWGDPATRHVAARLVALGLPTFVTEPRTTADLFSTAHRLGRLVGENARADSLVDAIRDRLARVERSVAGRPRPDVLFLVWPDPPFTAGPRSYADEAVRRAGGRNIFADLDRPWAEVSREAIVERDPDWIVVAGRPQATVVSAWAMLSAVREGRVLTVDPDLFHRPGPRVAEAVERLARRLHPEAFR